MKEAVTATVNPLEVQNSLSEFFGSTAAAKNAAAVKSQNYSFPSAATLNHSKCVVADLGVGSRTTEAIMKARVCNVDINDLEGEDAFYVADLGEVTRMHMQWKEMLPRVEPFFAMKCNPDPYVIKTLVGLGTGFDCASRAEIQTILDYGVDPSKIIYANPCKQASHIRYAASKGVQMMTFDNADELHKVKQFHPNAQLVLRILADDSKSLCKFGVKFGAPAGHIPHLLRTAQELDLNLIGVSFHVGSGCFDASAFSDAVKAAASVMQQAKSYGFEMSFLDLGGGFPCNNAPGSISFSEIVGALKPALDQYVPPHIRVIAEPGRYYVASAFTLAVNILARRVVPRDSASAAIEPDSKDLAGAKIAAKKVKIVDANGDTDMSGSDSDEDSVTTASAETLNLKSASTGDDHPSFMYYINDGMYGSFNCIQFDHAKVIPKVLLKNQVYMYNQPVNDEAHYPCSIWGPTCDSVDVITKEGSMPEMQPGDWMYFENMGAYTMAAASQFNGFRKSVVIYTNTFQHQH
ncbi:hypothetical protein HDV05_005927 [Chytridiales sp. JEL 0842]|nr:hypothetical protein HDV05_005927 [Chytridiales sp. JEL 0842]